MKTKVVLEILILGFLSISCIDSDLKAIGVGVSQDGGGSAAPIPTPSPAIGCNGGGFEFVTGLDFSAPENRSRPALNTVYKDSSYCLDISRVSAASMVTDGSPTWVRHEYSRKPAFNFDTTKAIMISSDGAIRLFGVNKTTNTLSFVKTLSIAEHQEAIWHPTNPNLIYHLGAYGIGMNIYEYDIRNDQAILVSPTLAAQITGRLGVSANIAWTKQEGRPSNNGKIWCLQVETSSNSMLGFIAYNLETDTVLGHLATTDRPDHISTSPNGNYCVPSWGSSKGTRAYQINTLSNVTPTYTQLHTTTEHSDLALDTQGEEVYVFTDYQSGHVAMVNMASGVRINLFELYYGRGLAAEEQTRYNNANQNNSATAMHISGIGSQNKPGYALVSTYACTANYGSSECLSEYQWFKDKIFLVELKVNPKLIFLAHNRYGNAGYFSETQAVSNSDFTKVFFTSTWLSQNEADVASYMIDVPVHELP